MSPVPVNIYNLKHVLFDPEHLRPYLENFNPARVIRVRRSDNQIIDGHHHVACLMQLGHQTCLAYLE
jgi:hypothetical protein